MIRERIRNIVYQKMQMIILKLAFIFLLLNASEGSEGISPEIISEKSFWSSVPKAHLHRFHGGEGAPGDPLMMLLVFKTPGTTGLNARQSWAQQFAKWLLGGAAVELQGC